MEDSTEFFFDEGLIHQVIRPLKTGKEASVHLCVADEDKTGHNLAVLKIYHPLERRDFRDESIYRDGEWIKDRRVRRALETKSKFGREVQAGTWVYREWECLQKLSRTPVPAPRPIAFNDDAILMTYVGDMHAAAPRLRETRPDLETLETLWQQIRSAIGQMLLNDVVHADLSPFNILVWEGEATLIDFPQAVDPKLNHNAEDLLKRDLQRVGEWLTRAGLEISWDEIAEELWFSWLHADLIPADYLL